jgi:hypothetical protein
MMIAETQANILIKSIKYELQTKCIVIILQIKNKMPDGKCPKQLTASLNKERRP